MMESKTLIFVHILLYWLFLKHVTTATTTTPPATSTTFTVDTTTLTPGVFDNCTASGAYFTATLSPNFDYIHSPNFDKGNYPRWYISAPENYSVEAYFDDQTYGIESNVYCSYDYVIFYDGNTTTDTMLNKFCGSIRPTSTYRSSGTEMFIIFSSDYVLDYAGFRIRVKAVSNTYPGCKADYTEYSVMYNRETHYIINNYTYTNYTSSPNFGISNYPTNVEVFWLFTSYNTTAYKMVLDITSISIERSYGCIYDKLVLYDGPCIKDGVRDTVCGYWEKRWDLNGPEYLLHFHSDGYLTRSGFQLEYYAEEIAVTAPPTTTTTTFGPPVEAVIEAIKEMLGNYSNENLPSRNLSSAITASVDFYLVGINGIDEVEQKMTSTGQFEVAWQDPSLSWDPTKRQGVVRILLPQNDVWKPDIALMNGFSSITAMGAKFMFIDVNYNGSCIWKPYQIMESVCKVDMTHYPYDRQTCVLKFGTWSTDDSEVVTELGSLGLQIHQNFQENAEWRLITTETKQEDNNNHKVVEFVLTLERNPRYVTFYMTMPIVVLAYMNVFTFVIPSESGEKTGFSITIFLSFVVLLIINNDSMPQNSDTLSLYAAFVLTMTILSAVALMISVLQIRALTFTERKYPIANRVKSLMKCIKRIQSILTCENHNTDKDDRVEEGKPDESKRADSSIIDTASENDALVKKVSFKDDNVKEIDDENNRFILPVQREPSKTAFKTDKENTLFETNTFVRSATALSLADKQEGESISERRVSITKTVTFAEEERQEINAENVDKHASVDNLTDLDVTAGNINLPVRAKTLTSSNDTRCQADSSPIAGLSSYMSITGNQSSLIYDRNSLTLTKEDAPTSTELYHEIAQNEIIAQVRLVAVSPLSELNEISKDIIASPTDNLAHNKSVSHDGKHLQATGIFQSGTNLSEKSDISSNGVDKIIKSMTYHNAKSSFGGIDVDQSATLGDGLQNSFHEGLESSMKVSTSNQSGSIADDMSQNQQATAVDFKMNRPSSTLKNRSLSVNRQFSSSETRLVLSDHGRAVSAGKSRPWSRNSGRAVSVLSQRSLTFNGKDSTALLFGADEINERSTDEDEEEVKSTKSQDSMSESNESSSSDESIENDLSWSDLVSCADSVFFIIYLLFTTIMTLAMFMTMIQAY